MLNCLICNVGYTVWNFAQGESRERQAGKMSLFFMKDNFVLQLIKETTRKVSLALRKEADKYINIPIFPLKRARIIYCFPYLYTS